jgi:hypothetical protein
MPGGPLDELTAALRRLYRDAGEPSTHEIGKGISYSHTTVAKALKGAQCPSWPVLEALVTYLNGDLEKFRWHWVAVRDAQDPLPDGVMSSPHGGEQLVLESGSGLARAEGEGTPTGHGERVVLRWKTRLETIEFLDEALALQWIRARMQIGDVDE